MTFAKLPADEAAHAQRGRAKVPCRVPGCTRLRDPNKLTCTLCWLKVPPDLRVQVNSTWRRYLRNREPLIYAEYAKAKDAALAAAQQR